MNKELAVDVLIDKIKQIEQANMESDEAESNEIRGRIVNTIIAELDKAVTADEN